ncbi:LPXTG cell wall anchor domain-containing protein [Clavibacter tessellarius]
MGIDQEVTAVGFMPGETVSATVNSTPMPLPDQIAPANGQVTFTFPIHEDFEIGQHSVTISGSVTGPVDVANTRFSVIGQTVPAGLPSTPIRGGTGGYGGGILPVTGGDADGMLFLGGIALLMMLTGAGALHRGRRSRQA